MSNEVKFDTTSGISIEEQKEILSQINGIAEKNRQSLSRTEPVTVKTKKKSAVFPLAVNAAAVLVLLIGTLLLVHCNSKTDAQVRTGDAVFNTTEKALIEEIRKETAEKIAVKEKEIASISSQLKDIDDELLSLHSSNQELTAEQRATQERLLALQASYRSELAYLENEKTQIIETSRASEARLRAQLDERNREYAAASTRAAGELEAAVRELERLANENERMRALEALIMSVRSESGSSGADHSELMEKNTELEKTIAELQKTIDALSSGGSGLTARISELEGTVTSLRSAASLLEQNVHERDTRISTLETENTSSTSEITRLRNANATQEQEITRLRSRIDTILQAAQDN